MDVVVPALTTDTPAAEQIAGQTPVLNGAKPDLRITHPALWRSLMVFGVMDVALGMNFIFLSPTFPIFEHTYYLWGGIFVALGTSKLVFLTLYRNLRMVRVTMAAAVAYMLFLSLGTTEPFVQGAGSLQLPILYLALAALELPLLLEPFVNPWTARRAK